MLKTELINDKKLSLKQFPNVYQFGSYNGVGDSNYYQLSSAMWRSLQRPVLLININRIEKIKGGQHENNSTESAGTNPDH